MFTMSTAAPYEEKKAKLLEAGSMYLKEPPGKALELNNKDVPEEKKKDPSPYAKPPPPPPPLPKDD